MNRRHQKEQVEVLSRTLEDYGYKLRKKIPKDIDYVFMAYGYFAPKSNETQRSFIGIIDDKYVTHSDSAEMYGIMENWLNQGDEHQKKIEYHLQLNGFKKITVDEFRKLSPKPNKEE